MEFYFDNAATTILSEKAAEAYVNTSRLFPGNPSSVHRMGQKAKAEMERRREHMASLLGVDPRSLVFTSGATESIALFFQTLLSMEKGTVVISRIEHEAVSSWIPYLKKCGWNTVTLRARGGMVDPDEFYSSLTPDTRAVAVMAVNNVTGAVEPIRELVEKTRQYEKENGRKILFFSDCVQALGKSSLSLTESGIDAASFSAHKINGPRGIGLLYAKNSSLIHPLASAGGQEKGRRGGTENLPAIAAFDEALSEWMEGREEREKEAERLNRKLRNALSALGLETVSPENASPFILSFIAPLPSEVFTRMLMDKGFCVSSGSACSNNAKGKGEGILEAMGVQNRKAKNAVRISLGRDTDENAVDELIKALGELING